MKWDEYATNIHRRTKSRYRKAPLRYRWVRGNYFVREGEQGLGLRETVTALAKRLSRKIKACSIWPLREKK